MPPGQTTVTCFPPSMERLPADSLFTSSATYEGDGSVFLGLGFGFLGRNLATESQLAGGGEFSPFVTKLSSDGGSGWSFAPGSSNTVLESVAAGASTFAIAGHHSGSADFNPGPGMDIIFGDVTFLSRFAF